MSSTEPLRKTTQPKSDKIRLFPSLTTAPPPVARTIFSPEHIFAIASDSLLRNPASPSTSKIHDIEAPQLNSISLSESKKSFFKAIERFLPTVDFPTPIIPIRTTFFSGLKRISPKNKEREAQENGAEYLRDYLSMLDGLVFGDGSSTGILTEGTYYHTNLRLKFSLPDDWTVRSGAREIMLEDTQGARTVTIGRSALPTENQTPEEYIKETLGRDDVVSGEMLEIGTYQGYLGEIENSDPKLSARLMAVVFKDRDVFVFDAKQRGNQDLEDFKQLFLSILLSIKSMSGEDSRLINQQRLELAFAQPGDTFEQLAKFSPLTSNAAETLRVINGFFPNGQPRAGDILKIVK